MPAARLFADHALAQAVDAFGYVDVLVNNARIRFQGPLIEGNQIGVFLGMQTLGRHRTELGRGSIINIVSVWSFAPPGHTAAYASTESALLAVSKAAAGESGPKGSRVNMIHPGGVATEMGAPAGVMPRNPWMT